MIGLANRRRYFTVRGFNTLLQPLNQLILEVPKSGDKLWGDYIFELLP